MSNPRFGVDRTINSTMQRLCDFYHADAGLLVTSDLRTKEHLLYRCDRDSPRGSSRPEAISSELAERLLLLPKNLAVCHSAKAPKWWFWLSRFYSYDVVKAERVNREHDSANSLAGTLDAASLISVPLFRHKEFAGRVYFSNHSKRFFEPADVHFLLQVLEHVSPIIENIRLVDRMACDAAEEERQRIARDIHDSVIQPYIGFQIGLNGVRRKLATGHADLGGEIDRLLEMTTVGITDLRRYVGGLKGLNGRETSLFPAIQRFATRFAEATGIRVDVLAHNEIQLNDGLAAEAFQMVAEGLSNIRRHTEAAHAAVVVACGERNLTLRIENDGVPGHDFAPFTPRSITDRARSLNGHTSVEQSVDGGTIVRVEIPL